MMVLYFTLVEQCMTYTVIKFWKWLFLLEEVMEEVDENSELNVVSDNNDSDNDGFDDND